MWKSFFLAIGIFLCVCGAECLAVQKFVLKSRMPPPATGETKEARLGPQRTIVPKDWTPWSLLSTGAIVSLYSYTIPRRMAGK